MVHPSRLRRKALHDPSYNHHKAVHTKVVILHPRSHVTLPLDVLPYFDLITTGFNKFGRKSCWYYLTFLVRGFQFLHFNGET